MNGIDSIGSFSKIMDKQIHTVFRQTKSWKIRLKNVDKKILRTNKLKKLL